MAAAALVALAVAIATPAANQADVEARIDALLGRMTLDEKLGQLQQLDGFAES